MSRVSRLLCEASPSGRVRTLTQYATSGNQAKAVGTTIPKLEAGVYGVKQNPMSGEIFMERRDVLSDGLLRFKDERQDLVLGEMDQFWKLKDNYDSLGFVHSRGMIMYGPPGSGKSCIIKLVMERMVSEGNLVLMCQDPSALRDALKQIREVESDRKIVVVMEDLDELARYHEHQLLEMFDGEEKIGGVLYIATTNFIERISERMLRPPRFDRKLEVPHPPIEGRMAYLQGKLGATQSESVIKEIAEKTEGFSFGHLRELIVSMFCLGHGLDDTVERLRDKPLQDLRLARSPRWTDSAIDQAVAMPTPAYRESRVRESRAGRVLRELNG